MTDRAAGHHEGKPEAAQEGAALSAAEGRLRRAHAMRRGVCAICGGSFPRGQLVEASVLRPALVAFAQEHNEAFNPDSLICHKDLSRLRADFVARLLEREHGDLTLLERQVVESLAANETLAEDVERSFERRRTFGDRMADGMANFGGSWSFIGLFAGFLAAWIAFNLVVVGRDQFDPYPFILLNLVLSCLAAIQAPVIMMSQKRVETRDRLRAENDFKVNLKAELEIRHLNEKLDHLLGEQWQRLAEIQEVQIDLLEAMNARKK